MTSSLLLAAELLLTVFLSAPARSRKIRLKKVYEPMQFLPLGGGAQGALTCEDANYHMVRSKIEEDAYFQAIHYVPPKAGLAFLHLPEEDKVFFDVVGPHFPLNFYQNQDDRKDLKEQLEYAEFINSDAAPLELDGFAAIEDYYESFDWEGGAEDDYEDFGSTHEFYFLENCPKELALDFSAVTLKFDDVLLVPAREQLKAMQVAKLSRKQFPAFYKAVLEAHIGKVDAKLRAKFKRRGLGEAAWNAVHAKILESLPEIYAQVAELAADIKPSDPLEAEKLALQKLFSPEGQALFQAELAEFRSLMELPMPFTAALFYKAKHNISHSSSMSSADNIVEAFNELMTPAGWYKAYFMSALRKLNLELLHSVFLRTNSLFQRSHAGVFMTNLDWTVKAKVSEPVADFLRQLEGLEAEVSVLDAFDLQMMNLQLLASSNPLFASFFISFSKTLAPELETFYKAIAPSVKLYKKPAGSQYDGKGSAAFTAEFYRATLKMQDPGDELYSEPIFLAADFFETYGRRARVLV